MCAIDDCEPWDVHRQEQRTARKVHHCDECGREIRTGERYTVDTGCLDAHWHTYRTCSHCGAAGEWLMVVCNGYPLGALAEELHEHHEEFGPPLLGQLHADLLAKWQNGQAPVPVVAEVVADAKRCLESLVAS